MVLKQNFNLVSSSPSSTSFSSTYSYRFSFIFYTRLNAFGKLTFLGTPNAVKVSFFSWNLSLPDVHRKIMNEQGATEGVPLISGSNVKYHMGSWPISGTCFKIVISLEIYAHVYSIIEICNNSFFINRNLISD